MTLVEAYSVGVPVVASRLGSLNELVEDGVTGLHFAPNDAEGLARSVKKLLTDADFSARLGRGARKRYEARFTPKRILNDLEKIYQSVLA
jgi:glycosyltransferase involved in cell wall biosynthesis